MDSDEALTGSTLLGQARALADAFESVSGANNAEVLHALLLEVAAQSMGAAAAAGAGRSKGGASCTNTAASSDTPASLNGVGPETAQANPAGASDGPAGGEAAVAPITPVERLPGGRLAALLDPMDNKDARQVRG